MSAPVTSPPWPPRPACPLAQQAPGRLALVALQLGVDDGAGGAADGQVLPGLHLVAQVGQTPLGINLELLLQGGGGDGGRMEGVKALWVTAEHWPVCFSFNQWHYC